LTSCRPVSFSRRTLLHGVSNGVSKCTFWVPLPTGQPAPRDISLCYLTTDCFRCLCQSLQKDPGIGRVPSLSGRDIVFGIASRYAMDSTRIECRWERDIPRSPRPALEPTQSPVQWVLGLSRGSSGRNLALTTNHHLESRLKKE